MMSKKKVGKQYDKVAVDAEYENEDDTMLYQYKNKQLVIVD